MFFRVAIRVSWSAFPIGGFKVTEESACVGKFFADHDAIESVVTSDCLLYYVDEVIDQSSGSLLLSG